MPREATVVAVVRRAHVVVPRGDTVLEPGDEVLVLASPDSEDAVRSLLVAEATSGGPSLIATLSDAVTGTDPTGTVPGA
jgi:NhaP-type Na+/H+ and K+/H+ antiporter